MAWALQQPMWLAALPLAAGPVLLAYLGRRRGRHVARWAVAAQCLAVALAATAIARPIAPLSRQADLPYLLLIDHSGSVRGQAPALKLPDGLTFERYLFAGNMVRAQATGPGETPATQVQPDETRLAPALRLLLAGGQERPAGAVLFTDGQFDDDDWAQVARSIGRDGRRLLIVPADAPPADARIVKVEPHRTTAGAVALTATISANAAVRRTVELRRSDLTEPLLRRTLDLLPDAPVALAADDPQPPAGAAEYVARIVDAEPITENNSATAVLLPVRPRLAIVEANGAQLDAAAVTPPAGADVPDVQRLSPAELPATAGGLAAFSAVVVADSTGQALTAAQRAALAEYVRAGGGLLMIGAGPYASPADRDDPLNLVLPLLANPYERKPLALRVLLDRSGSMAETTTAPAGGEQQKFHLAAEAVLALKDHLTARDSLAVVAFSGSAEKVYDSRGGPADFSVLRAALEKIEPSYSTHIVPALQEALAVPAPPGQTPLLLVLSDLQTQDELDARSWAEKLKAAGASLAIVAIGSAGDTPPPLETLARLTDAPYERRDHLAGLAAVFGRMVSQARGSPLREGDFSPRLLAPPFGVNLADLPAVKAYLLTAARPEAQVLATVQDEPFIASLQAAGGRSAVVAMPPDTNAAWPTAASGQALLRAAVAWLTRPANDPRLDVRLTRRYRRLHVDVGIFDQGKPVDHLKLTADVAGAPQAGGQQAELLQVAPGKYEAWVPETGVPRSGERRLRAGPWGEADAPTATAPAATATAGPAVVTILDGQSRLWLGAETAPYPAEYARIGPDMANLSRLAELSGGRILRGDQLAGLLTAEQRRQWTPLWPLLLSAALALMLAEWTLTRVTRR